LRHEIYDYVLYKGSHVFGPADWIAFGIVGLINGRSHLLALLQVSRQTYAETKLLPFSLNIFQFEESHQDTVPLQVIIPRLSLMQRTAITRVVLETTMSSHRAPCSIYYHTVKQSTEGNSFADWLPNVQSVVLINDHKYRGWEAQWRAVSQQLQKVQVIACLEGGVSSKVKVVFKERY